MVQSLEQVVGVKLFDWEIPYIHAKRRFDSDNRGLSFIYWWNVAINHKIMYEIPSFAEGYNCIIF